MGLLTVPVTAAESGGRAYTLATLAGARSMWRTARACVTGWRRWPRGHGYLSPICPC
jgi:hypothetical protein